LVKEETKMVKKYKCVICKKLFTGYGNNAEPVKCGRCCSKCNMKKVIPARIKMIKKW